MNKDHYILGQKYEIAPFGRSEIVKDTISMGTFVGYIQKKEGYPTSTKVKWPVFETTHYGHSILFALDKGECGARGATVKELMDDFNRNHTFWGTKYETIKVAGGPKLLKEEFIRQMGLAGFPAPKLENCLMTGEFYMTYFEGGEVKWCPRCKMIRQTTCCACGCGNCKTCDHRWTCGTPELSENISCGVVV